MPTGDCNDLSAKVVVKENLKKVQNQIKQIYALSKSDSKSLAETKLIAVSKTKPLDLIISCYEEGQRIFGENYVQELIDKAQNPVLTQVCPDIQWHFIGNLQSKKVNGLVKKVPNLTVETVDDEKLANLLDRAAGFAKLTVDILVQVNTSGEEQKGGSKPVEAIELANFIRENCVNLKLRGFMTIGSLDQSLNPEAENPDFLCLFNTRQKFCDEYKLNCSDFDLSMGMTNDMKSAIEMGSSCVRIGTAIFGVREKKV